LLGRFTPDAEQLAASRGDGVAYGRFSARVAIRLAVVGVLDKRVKNGLQLDRVNKRE
jgi:hypothetical protein